MAHHLLQNYALQWAIAILKKPTHLFTELTWFFTKPTRLLIEKTNLVFCRNELVFSWN